MKNIPERQRDILSIIDHLDISVSMYRNAIQKYEAIAQCLNDAGLKATIYPQGSFAFGTVVRPNAKDPNASYDLDFICQVEGDKSSIAPSELRSKIEKILSDSDLYGGKLVSYDECFTIEYADIGNIGFRIDIVPATNETFEDKLLLRAKCNRPDLIDTAIAIPKHDGVRSYSWLTNNPKGFSKWFEEINAPFLNAVKESRRKRLYEKDMHIYASIEEIPLELERSALQRVIQILKYHRNVYYANLQNGDALKPISAIINVAVSKIALGFEPNRSVFELLEYVLSELNIYAQQLTHSTDDFVKLYGNRSVLSRQEGKWYLPNPANPEDNLLDKWNEDREIPSRFFRWVQAVKNDFIHSLQMEDDLQFGIALNNGLGKGPVERVLGKKYSSSIPASPIVLHGAAKPYRSLWLSPEKLLSSR